VADYDRIAPYYDAVFGEVFPYDAEADALDRIFRRYDGRPVRTVLDASCGTGSHLVRLARGGYECCGSDISAGMVEVAAGKARLKGMEIDFLVQDIKRLAMERRFDAVMSLYGLPLMLVDHGGDSLERELKAALEGIGRVLEDKGLLVFNAIDAASPVPFPGFGPWCASNLQTRVVDGMEIVVMNKLRRSGQLLDFKDVYLVQDRGGFSMEILIYTIWLPAMEGLRAILEAAGFRVLALYNCLSTMESYVPQSLDVTVVAAKR
jgi:SAM-dependent methyltransferase